jgi:predicted metal-dependent hydrolase
MTMAAVERSQVRYGTKTIAYAIRRSTRRATVSIAIDPTEGVLVTAPGPAPIRRLDDIVHAKASWIIQRLKRQSDLPPAPCSKEFVSGETFLYLGRQHRLRVDLHVAPRPLRMDHGWLRASAPRKLDDADRAAFMRAALLDWYKAHAERKLPQRTAAWAEKLGIALPEVIVSDPRKRWGSASPSGAIRLNWRIIQAPISLVDYVVAHELVHLRHPNHTAAFWAELGRVMPDYEVRKARLRATGSSMDW